MALYLEIKSGLWQGGLFFYPQVPANSALILAHCRKTCLLEDNKKTWLVYYNKRTKAWFLLRSTTLLESHSCLCVIFIMTNNRFIWHVFCPHLLLVKLLTSSILWIKETVATNLWCLPTCRNFTCQANCGFSDSSIVGI